MRKLAAVLMFIAVLICLSTSAFAWTLIDTGYYWRQDISDLQHGTSFNRIDLVWLSGAQFAAPAMLNYSNFGSWTVTGSATTATAVGPTILGTSSIGYNFSFLGSAPAFTQFLHGVSLNSDVELRQLVTYDPSHQVIGGTWFTDWNVQSIDSARWDRLASASPVPEPASMVLLGMGVLGLFGLRKRA